HSWGPRQFTRAPAGNGRGFSSKRPVFAGFCAIEDRDGRLACERAEITRELGGGSRRGDLGSLIGRTGRERGGWFTARALRGAWARGGGLQLGGEIVAAGFKLGLAIGGSHSKISNN